MKYRKKPVIVDAEQFFVDKKPWPIDVKETAPARGDMTPRGIIKTLEGKMFVLDGDWIITGVKGEKYPCKPDIFELTYELL